MESNKQVVLKVLKGAFVERDVSVVDRYFSADYVQHNPAIPNGPKTIANLIPTLKEDSQMSVSVDTHLELRLHVSRTDIPIVVDLAAVRWVHDGHLGVEFLRMPPEHRTRLRQIIEQAPDLEGTT